MKPKNNCLCQDEKPEPYPYLYSKRVSIYQTALGLLGFIVLLLIIELGTAWAEKIPEETSQKLKGLRIPFIVNQGQMDRQVRFYAKTFSGTVYVTDQGKMVFQLPQMKDRNKQGWVLVELRIRELPLFVAESL